MRRRRVRDLPEHISRVISIKCFLLLFTHSASARLHQTITYPDAPQPLKKVFRVDTWLHNRRWPCVLTRTLHTPLSAAPQSTIQSHVRRTYLTHKKPEEPTESITNSFLLSCGSVRLLISIIITIYSVCWLRKQEEIEYHVNGIYWQSRKITPPESLLSSGRNLSRQAPNHNHSLTHQHRLVWMPNELASTHGGSLHISPPPLDIHIYL